MLKKIKELPSKFEAREREDSLKPKAFPDSQDQSDPLFTKFHSRNTMASIIVVEQGVIQDVFPFLRLYKVALNAGPITVCTYGGESTGGLFGVQDQTTLVVGTTVWVVRYPGTGYGTIISTQPEFITVPGSRKVDEIVEGSNIGYISEPIYRLLLAYKPPRGGMPMWEGAHLDSIPGEWVKMAQTGVALFVDPFLAGIRANDYCGVWVNYLDSLLRIAGLNYQRWTGGTEEYDYVDGAYVLSYKGYGYTTLDMLGSRSFEAKVQEIAPEFYHNSKVRASSLEPETATKPFVRDHNRFSEHRKQSWGGILGQGGLDITTTVFQRNDETWFPRGAVQVANTSSGYHIVQARRGILLSKYPYIPVPIKLFDFDEALSDQARTLLKRVSSAYKNMQRGIPVVPVGLGEYDIPGLWIRGNHPDDIRNLLCNWEALAGIYAYIDNFVIITEKDIVQEYNAQKTTIPQHALIFIDDGGDILIENSRGARIELVNKNIRITAPGNITIDCGDTVNIFGYSLRAYGEYEVGISTSRTKKYKNDGIRLGEPASTIYVDNLRANAARIDNCTDVAKLEVTTPRIGRQPWVKFSNTKPTGLRTSSLVAMPRHALHAYYGPPKLQDKEGNLTYSKMPDQLDPNLRESEILFGTGVSQLADMTDNKYPNELYFTVDIYPGDY